jgi:hypothetical protein
MSPANSDTTQGIDTIFDQDTPHSNLAWIRCECPNGSETGIPDSDIKTSAAVGLAGIYKTQLGDIYKNDGTIDNTSISF